MGTLVHHYKETGEFVGDNLHPFPRPLRKEHEEHIATLERKLFMSGFEREMWWPDGQGTHEVTFAFSPFTLELLEYQGDRGGADEWKASFAPLEYVTGTIDWLGRRGGRRWVDDLKTGAFPVDVETSKQLRTYAVVAWLLDGQPYDWECDVSITQWAKYPLAAEPVRTWHVLTGFDLREHVEDLKWALTHPEVKPVSYGPPQPDENGRYQFGAKLPVCAGCECREPVEGISGWVTNFWFRTLPHCAAGMMKRFNG